jgi:hypothetical protein
VSWQDGGMLEKPIRCDTTLWAIILKCFDLNHSARQVAAHLPRFVHPHSFFLFILPEHHFARIPTVTPPHSLACCRFVSPFLSGKSCEVEMTEGIRRPTFKKLSRAFDKYLGASRQYLRTCTCTFSLFLTSIYIPPVWPAARVYGRHDFGL